MKSRAIILLCTAGMTCVALAQTTRPAGQDDAQYIGVVTGTNVYVRHNPAMTAYPCTKVSRPYRVTVVGKSQDGWLKILPPKGTFSVISKQYVRPDDSGKIGTVTGNNVWVRAGGGLRETGFFGLQRQVNRGRKVKILGEVEDYYKIEPPEGVHFWISDRYVEAAVPAAVEAKEASAPKTRKPTPPDPMKETVTRQEFTEALARFRAVEAKILTEMKKSPEKRNLRAFIDELKRLKIDRERRLQPYVDYYIECIKIELEKGDSRKEFHELVKETAASKAEYEEAREILKTPPEIDRPEFAAKGILKTSAIFTGGASGPKRYLLRAPVTGVITAYVETPPGSAPLDKYIGKNVGVKGEKRYARELETDIIEASDVTILDEDADLPVPPAPIVKPFPEPPRTRPTITPKAAPDASRRPPAAGPAPLVDLTEKHRGEAETVAPAPAGPVKPEVEPTVPVKTGPKKEPEGKPSPLESVPETAGKGEPTAEVERSKPAPEKPEAPAKAEAPSPAAERPEPPAPLPPLRPVPPERPVFDEEVEAPEPGKPSPGEPKPADEAPKPDKPGGEAVPDKIEPIVTAPKETPPVPVIKVATPSEGPTGEPPRPAPVAPLRTPVTGSTTRPQPETRPASRPAVSEPVPVKDLPQLEPIYEEEDIIDEEEYD